MEPVSYEELVVNNIYVRRYKTTNVISQPSRYLGIDNQHAEFYGTIYLRFDGDFNSVFIEPIELIDIYPSDIIEVPHVNLDISLAPHIGNLQEGIDIQLKDDVDPISHTAFENGDECVEIILDQRYFVHKIELLQGWFNTGRREEPTTRINVRQNMLRRFTYCS